MSSISCLRRTETKNRLFISSCEIIRFVAQNFTFTYGKILLHRYRNIFEYNKQKIQVATNVKKDQNNFMFV